MKIDANLTEFANELIEFSKSYQKEVYTINCIPVKGLDLSVNNRHSLILKTIELFKKHHSDFKYGDSRALYDFLTNIYDKDRFYALDGELFGIEMYRVLWFIDYTDIACDFITTSEYQKKTFRTLQVNKPFFNQFLKHHKSAIIHNFGYYTDGLMDSKFAWYATEMYHKHQKLVKFYLAVYAMIDWECFKPIDGDYETLNFILEKLQYFSLQHFTEKDLFKSLAILLYFQLIRHLHIKSRDLAEVLAKNLVSELFGYSVNFNEFGHYVFIKSTFGRFPIFGASKTPYYNDAYVINSLVDAMGKEKTVYRMDTVNSFVKLTQRNLATTYLLKYPVELFRKIS